MNLLTQRRGFIFLVASIAAVLTVVASLVSWRGAAFDADVRATAIDLWLAEPSSIMPPLRLTKVTVGHVTRVESNAVPPTQLTTVDDATVDVRVGPGGQLILSEVQLPSGSQMRLEWLGAPHTFRLTVFCGVDCLDQQVHFTLSGPDTVSLGAARSVVASRSPRYLKLHTENTPLAIDFEIESVLDSRAIAQFALDSVEFTRRERFIRPDQVLQLRHLSSVIAGQVSFARVPGEPRLVRQNETLLIQSRNLQLRSLQLIGDTLLAGVSGASDQLLAGREGAERSIMPTFLDVAIGNPTVRGGALLLTTVIAAFASYARFSTSSKEDGNDK